MVTSLVSYVRPRELKAALNKQFFEHQVRLECHDHLIDL